MARQGARRAFAHRSDPRPRQGQAQRGRQGRVLLRHHAADAGRSVEGQRHAAGRHPQPRPGLRHRALQRPARRAVQLRQHPAGHRLPGRSRLQPGRGPVGAGQGRRAAELHRPRRQDALCRGRGLCHRARRRRLPGARRRRCRGHAQPLARRHRSRAGQRQVAERAFPEDLAAGWLQQGGWPSRDRRHAHLRLGRGPVADPDLLAWPAVERRCRAVLRRPGVPRRP